MINLNPEPKPSSARTSRPAAVTVLSVALLILLAQAPAAFSGETADASASTAVLDSVLNQTRSLKDKVVYVDFWASWCLPCRHSFPWMNTMADKYASRGLQIVTINLDKKHVDAEKFLRDLQIGLHVVYDSTGTLAKLFKVDAMPTSFLYTRDGRLHSRHRGFKEDEADSLDSLINVLTSKGAGE